MYQKWITRLESLNESSVTMQSRTTLQAMNLAAKDSASTRAPRPFVLRTQPPYWDIR